MHSSSLYRHWNMPALEGAGHYLPGRGNRAEVSVDMRENPIELVEAVVGDHQLALAGS